MFQLVFKGECTPGTDPAAARNNAKNLFKASPEQVGRMFSGQPVVIRNKLEEVQAEKYRAVLQKHGMVAYVQPMEGAKPSTARQAPTGESRAQTQPAPESGLGEREAASAKPASSVAVEPGDRLPVAGDKVDTILSGSGLTLDPVGVTLEQHREAPAPMFQHLDDWTLAPAGSELGVKRDLPPPMVPDVSHLSLADEDRREEQ
ncbi:hypothetical protein DIT71_03400 [Marinobacter vulgaris]|uniref:Uncharacterized protein n=1 Tax=Marinobacter vulgaris TaxID=1928331 RepID=A0A2V4A136_9GAMM|nr:hypothetical protein [Marinobacter vulgaris]PXX92264.1 hypothetical protein DIT71_03400 [Marinobacter vulgaris]TSJ71793.1 hypothetical protein FPC41_06070 [Marinobacter vulgaris]